MAEPKLCVTCGDMPKRAGHTKWCYEDWLPRRPPADRIAASKQRLAAVREDRRVARVPEAHWPAGRRWCAGCQSFVRLTYSSGSRCRDCASATAHASRLKSTYTIHGRPFIDDDYDALMAAQDGRCYLCMRQNRQRRLAVDHDHVTGQVRGLLCGDPEWSCNLKVVARFDADPSPLQMVERLRRYLSGDTPASKLPVVR